MRPAQGRGSAGHGQHAGLRAHERLEAGPGWLPGAPRPQSTKPPAKGPLCWEGLRCVACEARQAADQPAAGGLLLAGGGQKQSALSSPCLVEEELRCVGVRPSALCQGRVWGRGDTSAPQQGCRAAFLAPARDRDVTGHPPPRQTPCRYFTCSNVIEALAGSGLGSQQLVDKRHLGCSVGWGGLEVLSR